MDYPVRIAINPLVSTVGHQLPALASGSVIASEVLSLPMAANIARGAVGGLYHE